MSHLLLQQAGVAKIMSESQVCATYYSALTHDFEHLGVNNDYLIKSFHPLAVMYNDISPLENHHLAAAVRVMQRPECRFVKVCRSASRHPPAVVSERRRNRVRGRSGRGFEGWEERRGAGNLA